MPRAARTIAARVTSGESVFARRAAPPPELAEHNLDPVSQLVSALAMFDRYLALRSAGDAGAYSYVFMNCSDPASIIAGAKHAIATWHTAEQGLCTGTIAVLSGGDEQVNRSSPAVVSGLQPRVHATCGPANQVIGVFETSSLQIAKPH